jgi:uncharacterized protein YmfQ (DUF2313 family)
MVRTQITLTEAQHRRLLRVARSRGVSMAEVVRQAVDAVVPDEDSETLRRWERAAGIVGAFDSGGANIAERHDDYLGEEW